MTRPARGAAGGNGPQYERRREGPFDPGLLVGSTDAEILRSYLDLVRTWRGLRRPSAKQPLRLRATDVGILVTILGTDAGEIERRLREATGCSPRAARRGRRLLVASAGALSIGLVTASSFGGTATLAPTPPLENVRTVAMGDEAPTTDLQDSRDLVARVLVRGADAASPTPMEPATTAAVLPAVPVAPQEVPSAPVPIAEPPAAPPLPAGVEAMVTIVSVGINLPVVLGGQSVIDQGVAAHYTAPGWEPPVPAGGVGTYWLAAHHTTHGAPFGTLPDMAVGAEVHVDTGAQTFVYTVTSMEVTGLYPGDAAVYGTDPTAATILLQTCIDAERRLLVRGILTATL